MKEDDSQKGEYLLPANIKKESDIFSQTLYPPNSPNMCLLNLDIGQWMGKLRVIVTAFPVGSKLTFGLIRK